MENLLSEICQYYLYTYCTITLVPQHTSSSIYIRGFLPTAWKMKNGKSVIAHLLRNIWWACILESIKGLTIVSTRRNFLNENMEGHLMTWVKKKRLQGDTITQNMLYTFYYLKLIYFYKSINPCYFFKKHIFYDFWGHETGFLCEKVP